MRHAMRRSPCGRRLLRARAGMLPRLRQHYGTGLRLPVRRMSTVILWLFGCLLAGALWAPLLPIGIVYGLIIVAARSVK